MQYASGALMGGHIRETIPFVAVIVIMRMHWNSKYPAVRRKLFPFYWLRLCWMLSIGSFSHCPSTDLTESVADVITLFLVMEIWFLSWFRVMSKKIGHAEGEKVFKLICFLVSSKPAEPLERRLTSPWRLNFC